MLPNLGETPWLPAQSVWELHLSHWSGPLPLLEIHLDWVNTQKARHLFGRLAYLGLPVYGFGSSSLGNPTDSFGRNIYLDVFNAPGYGPGWKRENSFLAHNPGGNFCYGFYSHPTAHRYLAGSLPGRDGVELHLVTPESSPLALFGQEPSAAVASLLDEAHISFHGDAYAEVGHGRIALHPGDEELAVERVVALPVLDGPRVAGLPATEDVFMQTDDLGRARGFADVYVAGDCGVFPVKHDGIACQQADAIAEQIAARAGAPVVPQPFRPVLRGKLLTGKGERFLHNAIRGGAGDGRSADFSLWFPPTKVSGKYLSQWLPRLTEARVADEPEAEMEIEVPLPSGWVAGRQAMALDPYSPLR